MRTPNPHAVLFTHQLQAEPGVWKRYPIEKIDGIRRPSADQYRRVAHSVRCRISGNRGAYALEDGQGAYALRLRAQQNGIHMRYVPQEVEE